MHLIYIDQNILGYLSEGKFSLPKIDGFVWVYSDEHFAEITRSGNLELLNCLDRISARRIKIALDDKFRITNNVYMDDIRSASEAYDEYINTINESPEADFGFISLQSFFCGNRDAVQLNNVARNFESAIKSLMEDDTKALPDDDIKKELESKIKSIGREFELTLLEASKNLRPIQELRKSLAGIDISNIDKTKGNVIDQIWEKISKKNCPISKEQFFGKKSFYGLCQDEDYPLFLGIVNCYTVLNFIGYWPDRKMSKISKIYGINSDASHVGHAAFCTALLSEDFRLCKKASAIYQYLDIHTVVCHIQVPKSSS